RGAWFGQRRLGQEAASACAGGRGLKADRLRLASIFGGSASVKDLGGKTAFVTGAASGIGLGIATALAQAGVKVMLCDIEDAALERAVAELKLTNADVDGVRADV